MEIVVYLVMVAAIVIGLLMRRNRAKAAEVSPPPADFDALNLPPGVEWICDNERTHLERNAE
jgi:hypothetical protein